ncbi:Putative zincin peptidase [Pilibacter termitis]|uniref:Putative zincin peptidase n=1 Tax=Pilibacter termitis TaxID=263852 RepID=A0A1T4L623_9ENTE|nr:DUF3267 domain-containing protein [Pilibacter termitis]SJZ50068.1 Putative zincin peptidase [Pilibacter termitis]
MQGLKLIKSMNLLENKKTIFWLNIVSIPLFFLFLAIFGFLNAIINPAESNVNWGSFELPTLFLIILAFLLHEGIHGIFFKLFYPEGKVKFGYKNWCLYTTSPRSYYRKKAFFCISMAPFLLISLGFIVLFALSILSKPILVFLASLHAAGCIGDFYISFLVMKEPNDVWIEDTEVGMSFYRKSLADD